MELFQGPNAIASEIKFPPLQSMSRATRLGVMIIVIALAECAEAHPKVVLAFVGGVERAIAKLLHVTDRVDRPGPVVGDRDRNIEAPEQATETEEPKESRRHYQVRDDVDGRVFPQLAVPDLAHVGRVT